MNRIIAYSLILLGVFLLGDAAYDEHRGIAGAASPDGLLTGVSSHPPNVVKQAEDPQGFRDLMLYQWVRAPLALCAGLFILGLCRRADRIDPFSPDFAGNQALDELNRTLTEEQAKRHRPLK
ncbi:MAG: hypothetical protein V4710_03070 [Verrucomicrobiota bacterium]